MGTALVLGFLIGVCGFIAYTGDLLGRRLGKRRLSIFGLRPRHTAILCTVITGMVIAVTMVAVLAGVSAGVRLAVTRGEALLEQNRQYRQEADQLSIERGKLQTQIAQQLRHVETLQESNRTYEEQNRQIASRNRSLDQRNQWLTGKVRQLASASQQLTSKITDLRGSRNALEDEVQAARQKLAKTRAQLVQAHRDLASNAALLASNSKELENNLRKLRASQAHIRELDLQARRLEDEVDRRAHTNLIVHDGEELGRVTVGPGTPRDEILAQLQKLLALARQTAWEKGARPDQKHPHAVYLVNARLARALRSIDDWPEAAEREMLQLIVQSVRQWPVTDAVLLQAQAVHNSVRGEPVAVEIQPYPNRVAFRKGEEIASTTLDPSETRGQMLEQLAALLQTKVREVSLNRQMIPGPRNQLGEVRYDPLLEVADKVKQLNVPARVGAVAAREIRSADPLAVEFYVVPEKSPLAALRKPEVDDGE